MEGTPGTADKGEPMIHIILAALLAFPLPPLGATMGSTPYYAPVSTTATRTELPATGLATFYNPGVFQQVLATRGLPADACTSQGHVGCVAMLHEADQGRTVCINGYGPLLVVDSAASHHRDALVAKGWVIDIDPDAWDALGFPAAPTSVTVTSCE